MKLILCKVIATTIPTTKVSTKTITAVVMAIIQEVAVTAEREDKNGEIHRNRYPCV